jgi:hypothetical protein
MKFIELLGEITRVVGVIALAFLCGIIAGLVVSFGLLLLATWATGTVIEPPWGFLFGLVGVPPAIFIAGLVFSYFDFD